MNYKEPAVVGASFDRGRERRIGEDVASVNSAVASAPIGCHDRRRVDDDDGDEAQNPDADHFGTDGGSASAVILIDPVAFCASP